MIIKFEPYLRRSVLQFRTIQIILYTAPNLHVHHFIAQSVKMSVELYECDSFLFKHFLICNIILHVSLLPYRVI